MSRKNPTAVDVTLHDALGPTTTMELPCIDGAKVTRGYDPDDFADNEAFFGGISYAPVSGAWQGERVGVAFHGYYDDERALWSDYFLIRDESQATVVEVRAGAEDFLLELALNDMQATIDLLGIDVTGNRFANRLTGGEVIDTLKGGGGNDVLRGGAAADILSGGAGNDVLHGQGGADRLHGGAGKDSLYGESGGDRFEFRSLADSTVGASGRDNVRDFGQGDRIDLRRIDADTGERGNGAFDFIGRRAFSGEAGELRYAGGVVSGDVDGDGSADFMVSLAGRPAVDGGDFLL
jgi:Ca2+-binding RTX toxin-like protein